jgi:hypothetical protein
VRPVQRGPFLPFKPVTGAVLAGLLSLSLTDCGLFASRNGPGVEYYLPLTVQLRTASTVTNAQVTYQDACGQSRTWQLGGPLAETIKRKTGRVFEKVVTEAPGTTAIDGYQDVSVGLTQLDMAIPRKGTKKYPATLAIGLDFAYTAADGAILFSKKLKSIGHGEVGVAESSCEVVGLEKIAQEAIDNVTEGMAKQLGTSTRILEAAGKRRDRGIGPVAAVTAPSSPIAGSSASVAATPVPSPGAAPSPPAAASDESTTLMFRAIIRDENRNQLLHTGEMISVEIEVTNEGHGEASGVEILVAGTPELIEQIPGVLPVGDIPPGEVKRISLNGRIGTVKEAIQAELILSLRSLSPSTQLPSAKKFLVAMKPDTAPEATAMPVDVDELPKRAGKLKQPKAIGIAIGIGQFRESGLQRVKYAARDAEVVATYWQAILGIPPDRVRRLTDSHALKSDLAEILEEWLPRQVDSTTVVYIYVSGRGAVEGATGAVSLIPFDGTLSSSPRLYSLRRLYEALVRLPIQRAIVVLDLSLEQFRKQEDSVSLVPVWEQDAQGKEKVMWMVGNRAVQEAHPYDLGQHGLFTYELLKGLAGAADLDRDGTILAGELCTYTKGQVLKAARELFANEQEPICIPAPGQGAAVRLQPVAKLK